MQENPEWAWWYFLARAASALGGNSSPIWLSTSTPINAWLEVSEPVRSGFSLATTITMQSAAVASRHDLRAPTEGWGQCLQLRAA